MKNLALALARIFFGVTFLSFLVCLSFLEPLV
jgi:hypothetical protein